MVGKFLNFIRNLITLAVNLALLAGLLWGAYGAYRANGQLDQPMPGEAQRYAPGLTFREFWDSRDQQMTAWDDMAKANGKGAGCKLIFLEYAAAQVGTEDFFAIRAVRAHPYDAEYRARVFRGWRPVIPADEILYGDDFFTAWWAMFSNSMWWRVANDPGFPYIYNGVQVRDCKTTYPVHAAEQANGQ